jgi:hypothetical protein
MTNALRVKKEIIRALINEPTLKSEQIVIGHPGSEMELSCIFINGVRNTERARSLGKANRREELTVELALVSQVLTGDLLESEERAWAMLAGVEAAIASDSSLNGSVLIAEVVGFDQRSFNGPERNVVEITCEIRVLADKDLEA